MFALLRVRAIAGSGARMLGFGKKPEKYSEGFPGLLDSAVLEDVISRESGDRLLRVQHTVLPTRGRFVSSKTYRVRAQLGSGRTLCLIYKTVDLSPDKGSGFHREVDKLKETSDSIPLLVWGGIARNSSDLRHDRLSNYLPNVYYVAASASGRQYEVLQEDLAEFQTATSTTVEHVVRALPDLHDSLQEFINNRDPGQFTIDAEAYENAVDECTVQAIRAYAATSASRRATAIAAQVAPLKDLQSTMQVRFPRRPIHGDLTVDNVLAKRSSLRFKVIDWERTLIGFPHRDLAALIRNMPLRVQRASLELYAQTVPGISLADHTALYALSKRMHKLKVAAIWSVNLMQGEGGAFRTSDRLPRGSRILQARIERNLEAAEVLGAELLGQ